MLVDPGAGAVGRSAPRLDAESKIRGTAQYVSDLEFPGMLVAGVLRATVPHARLGPVDVSAALEHPGVVAVLSQDDVADVDAYYGHVYRDRPILADGVVRFAGEPIVAVAAIDATSAAEALATIDVEYEPLPVAGNVEAALAPGAPLLHAGPRRRGDGETEAALTDNVCSEYRYRDGDVETIFDSAPVVVEGTYRFPSVYQYAMEPHISIAHWTDDGVTVWSSCQHPFLVRAELAAMFGLPLGRVRMRVPFVGGGFGSKSYTRLEPLAVALSRKTGRPVRVANDIEGAMLTSRRHNMSCYMRTAADSEGRLLARQTRILMDTGAYADNGPRVTHATGLAAPGPYRWSALDVEALCVYTNRPPAGSYRGFGNAHMTWIGESQVDEIARRTGLDPLTIRTRNLVGVGEHLYPRMTPVTTDLAADMEAIARELDLGSPTPPHEGKGIAIGLGRGGAEPISTALVSVDPEGYVKVMAGSTEIGQGVRTVHSQIAAEVLGVPLGCVTSVETDTEYTPFDRSTGASRSTTVAGLAVQRAAEDALAQLRECAARLLDIEPHRIDVHDGAFWDGGRAIGHGEVVRRQAGAAGGGAGDIIGRGSVTASEFATSPVFWEVGAAGVHLSVDPDTGRVTLLKMVTVADVGRAINPALVERQDEGCAAQAIGNSLFEELEFTEDGVLANASLLNYRVPTAEDVPEHSTCIIIENGDGPGPFGAKGCGEGVFGGLPGAIVNALADAGVQLTELPATPERVWRAMRPHVEGA
jgi:CO/xanthine dehydrogenase Mo-binding subunit